MSAQNNTPHNFVRLSQNASELLLVIFLFVLKSCLYWEHAHVNKCAKVHALTQMSGGDAMI